MSGRIIPEQVAEDLVYQATRENIYRTMFPRPPIKWTRRDRFRYWRNVWKGRIELAIDALRGQHDCGDDW